MHKQLISILDKAIQILVKRLEIWRERKTESERKTRKYRKRKAFKTRKPIKHNLTFFQFTLPFHFSK